MLKLVKASTARNVWNHEDMDKALAELGAEVTSVPEFKDWFLKACRQYILTADNSPILRKLSVQETLRLQREKPFIMKSFARGVPLFEFDDSDFEFRRLKDDFEIAVLTLTEAKEKKVNLKSISWEEALTKGRLIGTKLKRSSHVSKEEKDLLLTVPGGAWYSLKNTIALEVESEGMGHCVGREDLSYGRRLLEKSAQIWSLRDTKNEPHITVELNRVMANTSLIVNQIRGKLNKAPVAKYRPALLAMLEYAVDKADVHFFRLAELNFVGVSKADVLALVPAKSENLRFV